MTKHDESGGEMGTLPDPRAIDRAERGVAELGRIYESATSAGITMDIRFHSSALSLTTHLGANEPVYAASVNKLLVARKIIEQADDVLIADSDLTPRLKRMLRDSSEEDAKILIGFAGGREHIDAYAEDIGLEHTRLGLDNLGFTTAQEAMDVMTSLLNASPNDSPRGQLLRHVAIDALGSSASRYGVRTVYWEAMAAELYSKTGDIFGEDDPNIGYAVHHDVGRVVGADGVVINYTLMSRARDRKAATKADKYNAAAGKEFLKMVGVRTAPAMARYVLRLMRSLS